MLSRIAESLFWIGRYVERADDTARLLDVHVQILLEDPWAEEDLACRSLLSVMDREPPPAHVEVGREYVLDMLAYDRFAPVVHRRLAGRRPGRTPGARARSSRPSCGSASTRRGTSCRRTCGRRVRTTTSRGCGSGPPSSPGSWTRRRSRDDTWNFMVLGPLASSAPT